MILQEVITPVNVTPGRTAPIRGICIHTSVGSYQSTIDWFHNPSSSVSAHYVVSEDGSLVAHVVHESDTAYAQGRVDHPVNPLVLKYGGNPNNYFVSIENADNRNPAAFDRTLQYPTLINLIVDICVRNKIPPDRTHICGHREIYSLKSCPGNIDVDYVVTEVAKRMSASPVPTLPVPSTPPVPTSDPVLPPSTADLSEILTHFQVKDKTELFAVVDQQYIYRDQARAQVQLLTEKFSDYDKIKNQLASTESDGETFRTALQTILLSKDNSFTTLIADAKTLEHQETLMQDQINLAQKNLDAEKQQHVLDLGGVTKQLSDLRVLFTTQQKENEGYVREIDSLTAQITALHTQGNTLTLWQKIQIEFQKLFNKGKQ